MKVSIAKVNNQQLSNVKTLKHRNSGIKSVSFKNTPFTSPVINVDQNPKMNEIINKKYQNYQSKNQQESHLQSQQQSQLVLALFEKCLRPQIPNIKHNLYESDQLESRVIFMINKAHSENFIDKKRPKSNTIKIGSKAQKHRQNNKSEPKQVYHQSNLTSKCQNTSQQNNKYLTPSQKQNINRTSRKINTKILMTKKNSPQITQFCSRLRKFQEDLKKTKKLRILTLDLNFAGNKINLEQNDVKNYMSLKSQQQFPKSQPISTQNIYVSPQFQQKNIYQRIDDMDTVNKHSFPRDKIQNRNSFHSLQKTKKIINYVEGNIQLANQKVLEIKKDKISKQIVDEIFNIDSLLPKQKQQIQYVLNRFKKDPINGTKKESNLVPKMQFIKVLIPQASCQNSNEQIIPSNNTKAEQSSFRQMQSIISHYKQSQTLRATDYNKKVEPLHKIDSPVSQRRKSVYNTKQKQNYQQSKLRYLNQGAKTIVTKYDSSDKRSIVEESVILFQCSKDLKPSFSKELLNLNDYAARYRGSLGVQTLINQNQEQYTMGNSRIQDNFFYESEETFDKILVTSNPNNGKVRKSYSIKQMDNNNNNNF